VNVRCLLALVGSLLVTSCGGSSPASPSGEERVSGAWIGHSTLTSVSGGECVGVALQGAVGSKDVFSARIQQSGNDLAASLTYQGNGTSCLYTGQSGKAGVDLTLVSCPAGRVEAFRCADGTTRLLDVSAARVAARVSNGIGAGTETTTWNVFAPGGTAPIGVLTTTAEFSWKVLGIPHDDFHIFDGSILPGYVDGVTIIPEEPNPFCTKCGWF